MPGVGGGNRALFRSMPTLWRSRFIDLRWLICVGPNNADALLAEDDLLHNSSGTVRHLTCGPDCRVTMRVQQFH